MAGSGPADVIRQFFDDSIPVLLPDQVPEIVISLFNIGELLIKLRSDRRLHRRHHRHVLRLRHCNILLLPALRAVGTVPHK